MNRLLILSLLGLLIVWLAGSAGAQTRVERGDTLVAQESGYLLTDAQWLDMVSAIDSLDYWRRVATLEEGQRQRWKARYYELDTLYKRRDAIDQSNGFGIRDAGLWGVLGVALGVSLDDLLED